MRCYIFVFYTIDMKGLELSECYFREYGLPIIKEQFFAYYDMMAAGLVGEGSECFGFDDEISRDHDWGPGFCIWLPPATFREIGAELQSVIDSIPTEYMGYEARKCSQYGNGRTGVFDITHFYQRFTGLQRPPETLLEWRSIPEDYLATATNGKVFLDNPRLFTAFRNELLNFYPEDIRLKKIAARCMKMAKSGQYNYARCMKRGEVVPANLALMQFVDATISMVFLLNKQYTPFYKWMHRAMKEVGQLGAELYDPINRLCSITSSLSFKQKEDIIEHICGKIVSELRAQGLTKSISSFLLDHGPEVQSLIQDSQIQRIPLSVE